MSKLVDMQPYFNPILHGILGHDIIFMGGTNCPDIFLALGDPLLLAYIGHCIFEEDNQWTFREKRGAATG